MSVGISLLYANSTNSVNFTSFAVFSITWFDCELRLVVFRDSVGCCNADAKGHRGQGIRRTRFSGGLATKWLEAARPPRRHKRDGAEFNLESEQSAWDAAERNVVATTAS